MLGLAVPLIRDSKNLGRRRKEPWAQVGTSADTHAHTHPQVQNSAVASVADTPGAWGHACALLLDLQNKHLNGTTFIQTCGFSLPPFF